METERVRIGCSGWYYWHWKGVVYPAELPSSRWFEHYQRAFDTVELNAPFYHWPRLATVQKWAQQAAPGFRYSVKVNQRIRASGAAETWAYFNNDFQGCAFRNAQTLKRLLSRSAAEP